jgi:hypothetical protein
MFYALLVATLIIHLGKFVDWSLGSAQERLKRNTLTDIYVFLGEIKFNNVIKRVALLSLSFLDYMFSPSLLSATWLRRATIYSLILNICFGLAVSLLAQRGFYAQIYNDDTIFTERYSWIIFPLGMAAAVSIFCTLFCDYASILFVQKTLWSILEARLNRQLALLIVLVIVMVGLTLFLPIVVSIIYAFVLKVIYFEDDNFSQFTGSFVDQGSREFVGKVVCEQLFLLKGSWNLLDDFCKREDSINYVTRPFYLGWNIDFRVYVIPAILPSVLAIIIITGGCLLRYCGVGLAKPFIFFVDRMQRSASGIFTQISTVAAAIVALLQIIKSR